MVLSHLRAFSGVATVNALASAPSCAAREPGAKPIGEDTALAAVWPDSACRVCPVGGKVCARAVQKGQKTRKTRPIPHRRIESPFCETGAGQDCIVRTKLRPGLTAGAAE